MYLPRINGVGDFQGSLKSSNDGLHPFCVSNFQLVDTLRSVFDGVQLLVSNLYPTLGCVQKHLPLLHVRVGVLEVLHVFVVCRGILLGLVGVQEVHLNVLIEQEVLRILGEWWYKLILLQLFNHFIGDLPQSLWSVGNQDDPLSFPR